MSLVLQLAAREREERTQALQKHLETSKAYAERIGSEERAGSKRRSAAQRQSEAEEASTCRILSAQEAARREAEQRRHDGALAAAVSAHKAESLREQKNVERIIAGSEELRELEARLRAAYVNKERHVQLAESAAMAAETDARRSPGDDAAATLMATTGREALHMAAAASDSFLGLGAAIKSACRA